MLETLRKHLASLLKRDGFIRRSQYLIRERSGRFDVIAVRNLIASDQEWLFTQLEIGVVDPNFQSIVFPGFEPITGLRDRLSLYDPAGGLVRAWVGATSAGSEHYINQGYFKFRKSPTFSEDDLKAISAIASWSLEAFSKLSSIEGILAFRTGKDGSGVLGDPVQTLSLAYLHLLSGDEAATRTVLSHRSLRGWEDHVGRLTAYFRELSEGSD